MSEDESNPIELYLRELVRLIEKDKRRFVEKTISNHIIGKKNVRRTVEKIWKVK